MKRTGSAMVVLCLLVLIQLSCHQWMVNATWHHPPCIDQCMKITADNNLVVYVNGERVPDVENRFFPNRADSITLPASTQVIAVNAKNTANDGGFLGSSSTFVTDRSWKCTDRFHVGWQEVDFDDSDWPAAHIVGRHGCNPWHHVEGISEDAYWIWTAPELGESHEKKDVYCRKRLDCGHHTTTHRTTRTTRRTTTPRSTTRSTHKSTPRSTTRSTHKIHHTTTSKTTPHTSTPAPTTPAPTTPTPTPAPTTPTPTPTPAPPTPAPTTPAPPTPTPAPPTPAPTTPAPPTPTPAPPTPAPTTPAPPTPTPAPPTPTPTTPAPTTPGPTEPLTPPPDPVPSSCSGRSGETGPSCITSCSGRANGDYQSCKGCQVYATCSNGVLIDNRPCPTGFYWDDRTKQCEHESSTCTECEE